jgi:hypothetical protein
MTRIPALKVSLIAVLTLSASCPSRAEVRGAAQANSAASCDYACLTGLLNQYLSALAAHDPSRLPLAADVKYTENTISLKVPDALWDTISGVGTYKIHFADPQGGEVGCECTIRENGTPAILVVRLRVVDRRITEVETVVRRGAEPAQNLEKRGPNPVWLEQVSAAERTPRETMLKAANQYFEGIVHLSGDIVPFDDQCNRILDGTQDTNNPSYNEGWANGTYNPAALGCRDNMNSKIWAYIKSVDPRRFMIVDEKIGIVFGFFMFNHPGTVKFAEVPGVGKIPMPLSAMRPFSVEVAEFFKIENGKVRQIEGVQLALPYRQPTGW